MSTEVEIQATLVRQTFKKIGVSSTFQFKKKVGRVYFPSELIIRIECALKPQCVKRDHARLVAGKVRAECQASKINQYYLPTSVASYAINRLTLYTFNRFSIWRELERMREGQRMYFKVQGLVRRSK